MSPVSQFWHHTSVLFPKWKTWVGYDTKRQYGDNVFDAYMCWQIFKLLDVRSLGAYKIPWRGEIVFQNWLKKAVPVLMWGSMNIRLWKARMQLLVSKICRFFKTHFPYKIHSLHQHLYWVRCKVHLDLNRFKICSWAHVSCEKNAYWNVFVRLER